MRIDVFTLFPEMFQVPFSSGIFQRAIDGRIIRIHLHNIRDYTHDRHRTVDDYPYGGGPGMVLKPEPVFEAVESVRAEIYRDEGVSKQPVVLLTPQGRRFTQPIAEELAGHSHLMVICGHYEGIDERIREYLITEEISIGDYVLTGGELPAMVVIDAVVRLVPGVLGSAESTRDDSHTRGLLEYPHYTRPPVYRDWPVPEVLLSGDHARIARWRREQVIRRTLERRPDLLEKATLEPEEKQLVASLTAAPQTNQNEKSKDKLK